MFRPLPIVMALGATILSTNAHAQQDLPPVDAAAILGKLEQLEQRQLQAANAAHQSALAQIKSAAASGSAAARLYEQAVEGVQFQGTKNKAGALSEWKDKQASLLRSKEAQTILLLHLSYLGLSLERKASDKPELFVQPSLAFVTKLAEADALFAKDLDRPTQDLRRSLLGDPLGNGIFVKWLKLGNSLPDGKTWELTPGNISGILEKNVRPVLREARNRQLLDTWDLEMKIAADRASATRRDFDASQFNTVVRPRLQFARINDLVVLGSSNRAVTELFDLAQTYPQHPDFNKWAARIRELLAPPSKPAPATGSAEAPSAPPTAG